MFILFIIILIAAWAVWVDVESRKEDYKQEAKVEVDTHWPFPDSKRP